MSNFRNTIIMRRPASWWNNMWRGALPSGNGRIGAAVYGGVMNETILINSADLWCSERKPPLPDISHMLPEMRQMIFEGQYDKANTYMLDALLERGYEPSLAAPLPLGDINILMPCLSGFTNYRRCLDLDTGEVSVSWRDGSRFLERTLFVSRPDDMVVCEIRCDSGTFDASITMTSHDLQNISQQHSGRVEKCILDTFEVRCENGYLLYAAQNDDGTDFGAVIRVISDKVKSDENTLSVCGAGSALMLARVFTKGDRVRDWGRLRETLATESRSYRQMLEPHAREHGRLFGSVSLDLGGEGHDAFNEELLDAAYEGNTPTALVEKMWSYGRYLFVSGTRSDGLLYNMYGLWVGDYYAPWSYNTANENVQMIYWHALAGGLTELMSAFFDYFDAVLDELRENARKLFGCRGIYLSAGSSPGYGLCSVMAPVILNWTAGAGWIAQHYYDYYLYTGDVEFLQTRALPFMREVALFYQDFFIVADDGYLISCPSVSPENSPGSHQIPGAPAMSHSMPTAINATMDFAVAKELLSNLICGASVVGIYQDEVSQWKEMLERIPPYQINEDEAIREWMHPLFNDNYHHRHQSHAYPVFPGKEVYEEHDPDLFKAFETAVMKRLVVGLSNQSGWSLAHMANTYARLNKGDNALECLELLSRSCLLDNFYTLHNDWRNMGICLTMPQAPVQMDANMGWVSAVQEMLLFSTASMIKLLPGRPAKWNSGNVIGLRFCGGEVSMRWNTNDGSFSASIKADRDFVVTVKLPSEFSDYKWQDSDVEVSMLSGSGCYIKLFAKAGGLLRVWADKTKLIGM